MPRFLIEIRHSGQRDHCAKSLHALMEYGSHLVTHAEFGCDDGVHAGWLIVDVDNRDEAMHLVPPEFRADARVIRLRKWTREQIEALMK